MLSAFLIQIERTRLRAKLDGLIAHFYGLTVFEFAHILTTFPLVAEAVKVAALTAYRDMKRGGGEMIAIQIVEILDRSIQGITKPFYCRCEDGQAYFVKGHGAGKQSLIAEYMGSRLARSFGLPVADFEIVEVPQVSNSFNNAINA